MWPKFKDKLSTAIVRIPKQSESARLVTSAAARTTMLMVTYVVIIQLVTGQAAEAAAVALLFYGPLTFGLVLWIMGGQADKRKAMQADPTLSSLEYFKHTVLRPVGGAVLGFGGIAFMLFTVFMFLQWDLSLQKAFAMSCIGCGGLVSIFQAMKLLGMSR